MDQQEYYSTQGLISDPGKYEYLLKDLPTDIKELCHIVHTNIIHRDATLFYNFEIPENRKAETETRYMEDILHKIMELEDKPLTTPRLPEKRFAGSCRDFALLFCSILRSQGIPARLRCGFAGYFNDMWDDHWICEYWNKEENNWILVDPEIDEVEYKAYKLSIDPLNIPREKFLTGGEAWIQCRNGEQDANKFGVSTIQVQGLWFVRGNVVRDLAALNKIEVLPWDYWGIADKDFDTFTDKDYELIDDVAEITSKSDLQKVRDIYNNNDMLRITGKIRSYATFAGEQMVELRR